MKYTLKFNTQGHAYFPKELRELLTNPPDPNWKGLEFEAVVNRRSIVLFRKGEHPDLVKKSLGVIIEDLDLSQLTTIDITYKGNLLTIRFDGNTISGNVKPNTTLDELTKAVTNLLTKKYHLRVDEKEIRQKLEPFYVIELQ